MEEKEVELREIKIGELKLMFTRLAIDVIENPQNYDFSTNMSASIDEFFRQENFRRNLIKES